MKERIEKKKRKVLRITEESPSKTSIIDIQKRLLAQNPKSSKRLMEFLMAHVATILAMSSKFKQLDIPAWASKRIVEELFYYGAINTKAVIENMTRQKVMIATKKRLMAHMIERNKKNG